MCLGLVKIPRRFCIVASIHHSVRTPWLVSSRYILHMIGGEMCGSAVPRWDLFHRFSHFCICSSLDCTALPVSWWVGRAGWGSLFWLYLSSFQATQTYRPLYEFDLTMWTHSFVFPSFLSFSFGFLSFAGHFLALNFQNSIGGILKISKLFKGYIHM